MSTLDLYIDNVWVSTSSQRLQQAHMWQFLLYVVSVGVVSSYNRWLNWYAAAAAVCVWSCRPPCLLPCIHVGLAALEWSMPCWLSLLKYGCLAWLLTPKALSSKFRQKLSAYMRVMPHSHSLTARVSTTWTASRPLGLHVCVGVCAAGPHRLLLRLHTS